MVHELYDKQLEEKLRLVLAERGIDHKQYDSRDELIKILVEGDLINIRLKYRRYLITLHNWIENSDTGVFIQEKIPGDDKIDPLLIYINKYNIDVPEQILYPFDSYNEEELYSILDYYGIKYSKSMKRNDMIRELIKEEKRVYYRYRFDQLLDMINQRKLNVVDEDLQKALQKRKMDIISKDIISATGTNLITWIIETIETVGTTGTTETTRTTGVTGVTGKSFQLEGIPLKLLPRTLPTAPFKIVPQELLLEARAKIREKEVIKRRELSIFDTEFDFIIPDLENYENFIGTLLTPGLIIAATITNNPDLLTNPVQSLPEAIGNVIINNVILILHGIVTFEETMEGIISTLIAAKQSINIEKTTKRIIETLFAVSILPAIIAYNIGTIFINAITNLGRELKLLYLSPVESKIEVFKETETLIFTDNDNNIIDSIIVDNRKLVTENKNSIVVYSNELSRRIIELQKHINEVDEDFIYVKQVRTKLNIIGTKQKNYENPGTRLLMDRIGRMFNEYGNPIELVRANGENIDLITDRSGRIPLLNITPGTKIFIKNNRLVNEYRQLIQITQIIDGREVQIPIIIDDFAYFNTFTNLQEGEEIQRVYINNAFEQKKLTLARNGTLRGDDSIIVLRNEFNQVVSLMVEEGRIIDIKRIQTGNELFTYKNILVDNFNKPIKILNNNRENVEIIMNEKGQLYNKDRQQGELILVNERRELVNEYGEMVHLLDENDRELSLFNFDEVIITNKDNKTRQNILIKEVESKWSKIIYDNNNLVNEFGSTVELINTNNEIVQIILDEFGNIARVPNSSRSSDVISNRIYVDEAGNLVDFNQQYIILVNDDNSPLTLRVNNRDYNTVDDRSQIIRGVVTHHKPWNKVIIDEGNIKNENNLLLSLPENVNILTDDDKKIAIKYRRFFNNVIVSKVESSDKVEDSFYKEVLEYLIDPIRNNTTIIREFIESKSDIMEYFLPRRVNIETETPVSAKKWQNVIINSNGKLTNELGEEVELLSEEQNIPIIKVNGEVSLLVDGETIDVDLDSKGKFISGEGITTQIAIVRYKDSNNTYTKFKHLSFIDDKFHNDGYYVKFTEEDRGYIQYGQPIIDDDNRIILNDEGNIIFQYGNVIPDEEGEIILDKNGYPVLKYDEPIIDKIGEIVIQYGEIILDKNNNIILDPIDNLPIYRYKKPIYDKIGRQVFNREGIPIFDKNNIQVIQYGWPILDQNGEIVSDQNGNPLVLYDSLYKTNYHHFDQQGQPIIINGKPMLFDDGTPVLQYGQPIIINGEALYQYGQPIFTNNQVEIQYQKLIDGEFKYEFPVLNIIGKKITGIDGKPLIKKGNIIKVIRNGLMLTNTSGEIITLFNEEEKTVRLVNESKQIFNQYGQMVNSKDKVIQLLIRNKFNEMINRRGEPLSLVNENREIIRLTNEKGQIFNEKLEMINEKGQTIQELFLNEKDWLKIAISNRLYDNIPTKKELTADLIKMLSFVPDSSDIIKERVRKMKFTNKSVLISQINHLIDSLVKDDHIKLVNGNGNYVNAINLNNDEIPMIYNDGILISKTGNIVDIDGIFIQKIMNVNGTIINQNGHVINQYKINRKFQLVNENGQLLNSVYTNSSGQIYKKYKINKEGKIIHRYKVNEKGELVNERNELVPANERFLKQLFIDSNNMITDSSGRIVEFLPVNEEFLFVNYNYKIIQNVIINPGNILANYNGISLEKILNTSITPLISLDNIDGIHRILLSAPLDITNLRKTLFDRVFLFDQITSKKIMLNKEEIISFLQEQNIKITDLLWSNTINNLTSESLTSFQLLLDNNRLTPSRVVKLLKSLKINIRELNELLLNQGVITKSMVNLESLPSMNVKQITQEILIEIFRTLIDQDFIGIEIIIRRILLTDAEIDYIVFFNNPMYQYFDRTVEQVDLSDMSKIPGFNENGYVELVPSYPYLNKPLSVEQRAQLFSYNNYNDGKIEITINDQLLSPVQLFELINLRSKFRGFFSMLPIRKTSIKEEVRKIFKEKGLFNDHINVIIEEGIPDSIITRILKNKAIPNEIITKILEWNDEYTDDKVISLMNGEPYYIDGTLEYLALPSNSNWFTYKKILFIINDGEKKPITSTFTKVQIEKIKKNRTSTLIEISNIMKENEIDDKIILKMLNWEIVPIQVIEVPFQEEKITEEKIISLLDIQKNPRVKAINLLTASDIVKKNDVITKRLFKYANKINVNIKEILIELEKRKVMSNNKLEILIAENDVDKKYLDKIKRYGYYNVGELRYFLIHRGIEPSNSNRDRLEYLLFNNDMNRKYPVVNSLYSLPFFSKISVNQPTVNFLKVLLNNNINVNITPLSTYTYEEILFILNENGVIFSQGLNREGVIKILYNYILENSVKVEEVKPETKPEEVKQEIKSEEIVEIKPEVEEVEVEPEEEIVEVKPEENVIVIPERKEVKYYLFDQSEGAITESIKTVNISGVDNFKIIVRTDNIKIVSVTTEELKSEKFVSDLVLNHQQLIRRDGIIMYLMEYLMVECSIEFIVNVCYNIGYYNKDDTIDKYYDLIWNIIITNYQQIVTDEEKIKISQKNLEDLVFLVGEKYKISGKNLINFLSNYYNGNTQLFFYLIYGVMPQFIEHYYEEYQMIQNITSDKIWYIVLSSKIITNKDVYVSPYMYILYLMSEGKINEQILEIINDVNNTNIDKFINRYDILLPDKIDNKLKYFVEEILNYIPILNHEYVPLPSLIGKTRDEMYNLLSKYTMKEIYDAYHPESKSWYNRDTFITVIYEEFSEIPTWEFDNIKCKSNELTIKYGLKLDYNCYNVKDLVKQWNLNSESKLTIPGGNKEFPIASIEQLKSLLENYNDLKHIELLTEFYEKVVEGIDLYRVNKIILDNNVDEFSSFVDEQKGKIILFLLWLFLFGMYMRNWKGTNYPFPIDWMKEKINCDSITENSNVMIQRQILNHIMNNREKLSLFKWIEKLQVIRYDFEKKVSNISINLILGSILNKIRKIADCNEEQVDLLIQTTYVTVITLLNIDHDQFNTLINDNFSKIIDMEKTFIKEIKEDAILSYDKYLSRLNEQNNIELTFEPLEQLEQLEPLEQLEQLEQ